jgi:branched-chain amino acid transport system substrate-binding protein
MKWLLTIGVAAALAGTAGIASAETVKVGLVMSASGAFARWGEQTMGAVRIYQEQHGTSVDGNEIQIILRDDGGPDPARAKQLTEELILRDKVSFLMGYAFTPNALSVADLITEAQIPAVITNAATGVITTKSPYYVRVSFTLPQVAAPMGQWSARNGIKTAVTVVTDYGPGIDAETYFNKAFKAGGGTVIESMRVPIVVTDFAPFYERVLRDKPDGLFIFGPGGPNSLSMVQQWSSRLRSAGITLLCTGEMQQIDMSKMGDWALGVVSAFYYTETNPNKLNTDLIAAWHKEHTDPDAMPDNESVGTYDAMELIYRAVHKFGPHVTGDQAMEFFKGMKVDSPRGSIMIDPKTRDVVQNVYFRKVEKRDGKLVNIDFDVIKDVKDPWKEDHPQ